MDAATLYTIVTMLDGRDRIFHEKYPSVAKCEAVRAKLAEAMPSFKGRPTRHTCEQHMRYAPNETPAKGTE